MLGRLQKLKQKSVLPELKIATTKKTRETKSKI